MTPINRLSLFGIAVSVLTLLSGCESTPKSLPATAAGKRISVVDTDDDALVRVYHAQIGAAPMTKSTVVSTLAVNPNSRFNADAKSALGAVDASERERLSNAVFKDFSGYAVKAPIGTVLAIPVNFSVTPLDVRSAAFKVCIEGICANPFAIKLGLGAYKLDVTVTPEKFLLLTTSAPEAKGLDSRFDSMGRQGHAILYATVDRVSNEARYAPTVYASVYRVALKEFPTYGNPNAQGIYRFPDLANIQVKPNP